MMLSRTRGFIGLLYVALSSACLGPGSKPAGGAGDTRSAAATGTSDAALPIGDCAAGEFVQRAADGSWQCGVPETLIDPDSVRIPEACAEGEFVQRGANGAWQCALPSWEADLTGLSAGAGLSGGGASGDVALAIDFSQVAAADHRHSWSELNDVPTSASVGASCATEEKVLGIDVATGMVECAEDADAGGTVTAVMAGAGLLDATITSKGTLAIDFAGSGKATSVARSDHEHADLDTRLTTLESGIDSVFCDSSRIVTGQLNVLCFGAIPDDDLDDLDAITAALAAAPSTPRRLYFPGGRYNVSAADCNASADGLIELADGDIVEGDGSDMSVIQVDNGASACAVTLFKAAAASTATLRHLGMLGPDDVNARTLSGPEDTGGPVTHAILHGGSSGNLTVDNVAIERFVRAIYKDSGAVFVRISNSSIKDCFQGYSALQPVGRTWVLASNFSSIGKNSQHQALSIAAPFDEVLVDASNFESVAGAGLLRRGCTQCDPSGPLRITNNRFVDVSRALYVENGTKHATGFANNYVAAKSTGFGVQINIADVVIANNHFKGPGIYGDAEAVDATVTANHFDLGDDMAKTVIAIDLGATKRWKISNNTFKGQTAGMGVRLTETTDTSIQDNVFSIDGGPGIRLHYRADRVLVTGNRFSGNDNGYGGLFVDASAGQPWRKSVSGRIAHNTFNMEYFSIYADAKGLTLDHNDLSPGIGTTKGGLDMHPGVRLGTALASANAVTVPNNVSILHITGTMTINDLVPPGGFVGPVTLIADAAFAFGNAGNVRAQAAAMTPNRSVTLIYDGSLWYEAGRGN